MIESEFSLTESENCADWATAHPEMANFRIAHAPTTDELVMMREEGLMPDDSCDERRRIFQTILEFVIGGHESTPAMVGRRVLILAAIHCPELSKHGETITEVGRVIGESRATMSYSAGRLDRELKIRNGGHGNFRPRGYVAAESSRAAARRQHKIRRAHLAQKATKA